MTCAAFKTSPTEGGSGSPAKRKCTVFRRGKFKINPEGIGSSSKGDTYVF